MLTRENLKIKLSSLAENYTDLSNTSGGVTAYGDKLDVRPAFQREFIYNQKQMQLLVDSVLHNYDIGKFIWGSPTPTPTTPTTDKYEVIDGQQRTISLCRYMNNEYSVDFPTPYFYNNLPTELKEAIDNYEIDVVVYSGTREEKLDLFKRINIAGEQLTSQELRNAVYTSEWLEHAKRYFSKPNGICFKQYSQYLNGSAIRQDYLETALRWASHASSISIEEYMSNNAIPTNNTASALISYFESVMEWVKKLFPRYRKDMKGIEWGVLYNTYRQLHYSDEKLQHIQDAVDLLYADEDVTNYKGIYEYVLAEDSTRVRLLSIRSFDTTTKKIVYARQGCNCLDCNKPFNLEDLHAHHIKAWADGGKTNVDNCALLCPTCHTARHNNTEKENRNE